MLLRLCQEILAFTDDPHLPRQRKVPRRYDGGALPHNVDTPKVRYRHAYYEVLDLAIGEIERFDHYDLNTVKRNEILLINAGNGTLRNLPYLKGDFNHNHLKIQLFLVKDMVMNAGEIRVTRVTNVRTISDTMNTSCIYKNMLKLTNS